jgi:hypothetical protein
MFLIRVDTFLKGVNSLIKLRASQLNLQNIKNNYTKGNFLKAIKISITSFIDDHQPGFVECKFHDAFGKEHVVQEKVPIVTDKDLDADSEYPQDGFIACEIVKEWNDAKGRKIFTIDTSKPWGVDTIEGLTEFEVLEEQLTDRHPDL